MITTIAFSAFIVASCVWMGKRAIGDHRAALAQRRGLLDEATGLFPNAKISVAPDHFPMLVSRLEDGRQIGVELLADTMVTRRLPQLWLRATLSEAGERCRPTIGALARPTGAEYYSLVHDMPEWMTPPETGASLLMRGDGRATARQVERAGTMFRSLFADPAMKEAVISPRGTRVILQAAQGERAAHLFLRQVRFPVTTISASLVKEAVAKAEALSEALAANEAAMPVYEAA
ncbi:hypothetical protein RFM26_30110 [Mesorhizobium sp. VK23B]|uniref:Uncharacterized protein n=1 Tax=Mesorhizobium dulcispinae TaxID=3072316 RepID=A0ABU4XNF6_9HYPH|nr:MULTISPECIES: hypothetical protein [unclassified Mesorhizobium]MDX8469940.1 hypothetical protein [Mesorhizobium sp. VK23B]MDX8476279.1 hypothetical protein [Mesorhizobium sp. VK23A]